MMHAVSVKLLRYSCLLTIVGLALCMWSLFDPRPIPVVIAMSVAQGIGSLAFGLYLWVIVLELRRKRVFDSIPPPRGPEKGAR
jgi:peptidoglycan/LPS O-acetylase OafA/YrhL